MKTHAVDIIKTIKRNSIYSDFIHNHLSLTYIKSVVLKSVFVTFLSTPDFKS